jgi:hypothetical protein
MRVIGIYVEVGRVRWGPFPIAATESRASTPEEVFRQESASLSPPSTFTAVPDCNCVTVRWGGEQQKGSDQSVG